MQSPSASVERWRKALAEPAEGAFNLVACVDSEVVGQIHSGTFPHKTAPSPRRTPRHGGARRLAGQGRWLRSMQAAVDLADKWLNLSGWSWKSTPTTQPAVLDSYKKFGLQKWKVRCAAMLFACPAICRRLHDGARLREEEPYQPQPMSGSSASGTWRRYVGRQRNIGLERGRIFFGLGVRI